MNLACRFPDLQNKSVFITGGGAGIGEYLTRGFAAQGARVCFVQRSDCEELCASIEREHGKRPLFQRCDVTQIDQLQSAIEIARSAHGPIDVLVNNAANDQRHDLQDLGPEDWDDSLNVNLRPHYFTAQAVAEDMKTSGGGSIINFSSISYLMGNAGYPAYMTAKAGIVGLTRALARELGPGNIRVNALVPGWVMTRRQRDKWVTEEGLADHLTRQCLKQEIMPEDMVEPTLFLASDASRMITSQSLVVDGGVVMTG